MRTIHTFTPSEFVHFQNADDILAVQIVLLTPHAKPNSYWLAPPAPLLSLAESAMANAKAIKDSRHSQSSFLVGGQQSRSNTQAQEVSFGSHANGSGPGVNTQLI